MKVATWEPPRLAADHNAVQEFRSRGKGKKSSLDGNETLMKLQVMISISWGNVVKNPGSQWEKY